MDEEYVEEEQKKGFFAWLGSIFKKKDEEEEQKPEEEMKYKRRLFDGSIEKYLDQNLDSYITEYGIVTELDLQGYEERYESLTGRVKGMKEYILDSDAVVGQMEKDLALVKKKAKPARK